MLPEGRALAQSLARAITTELPESVVELREPAAPPAQPDPTISLLMLSFSPDPNFMQTLERQRTVYRNAAICLLVDQTAPQHRVPTEWIDSGLVQGYLPYDYTLDIWLAAIALLVNGAEFYPVRRQLGQLAATFPIPETPSIASSQNPARSAEILSELTPREYQILALVSQGQQNKNIADRMQLSEHTVKVHVHNVISKLRVRNRTQAAAAFLAHAPAAAEPGCQNAARNGRI